MSDNDPIADYSTLAEAFAARQRQIQEEALRAHQQGHSAQAVRLDGCVRELTVMAAIDALNERLWHVTIELNQMVVDGKIQTQPDHARQMRGVLSTYAQLYLGVNELIHEWLVKVNAESRKEGGSP